MAGSLRLVTPTARDRCHHFFEPALVVGCGGVELTRAAQILLEGLRNVPFEENTMGVLKQRTLADEPSGELSSLLVLASD